MKNPMISIVSPAYNEEENIPVFLKKLLPVLENLHMPYEIIFISDGSTDGTLDMMLKMKNKYADKEIRVLNFSRNFGKEAAITAGLDKSRGDLIIPIDADLQHPPQLIEKFIDKWREGYDVVLAKRKNRFREGYLKRTGASFFYKIITKISDITVPEDVGDYRLMTRKVVDAIKGLPENQRFMKGLFAWIGFKTATVEYDVRERHSGSTGFNIWKLWNLAIDGITSFSTWPLRIWTYIGMAISSMSLVYATFIIIKTLVFGVDTPGFASLMVGILMLGGIQLIGIGILGEYIGRIYMESKRRPTYIIDREY
ncbi:glycosyltransferase family 2 protein [Hydrogenimonas sp. SS33]|uniref:glycosyltransferase family 2 protein n=1 Tax=Hydrogenimonas leucolamina TaxID=2954236 RepID=UPI00336BE22B